MRNSGIGTFVTQPPFPPFFNLYIRVDQAKLCKKSSASDSRGFGATVRHHSLNKITTVSVLRFPNGFQLVKLYAADIAIVIGPGNFPIDV